MPVLLSGLSALVLSAGAWANGPDKGNAAAQNSTPTSSSQPAQPATSPRATSATNTMNSDTSMSATAQTKFDSIDSDHDGSVSKQEAMASNSLNAEFTRLDANKDNKLSLAEFMSAKNLASIKVDKNDKSKSDKKSDY
jgi:hypothetical protein